MGLIFLGHKKVVWEQVGVYSQLVVCRQVGGWTQLVMGIGVWVDTSGDGGIGVLVDTTRVYLYNMVYIHRVFVLLHF